MRILFQDELTTKMLFGRIKKEIREEQLEKAIDRLEFFNEARKKIVAKCDFLASNGKI